jgi:hypothetical protein
MVRPGSIRRDTAVSAMPSIRPAASAPAMLPTPPMMTTIKAFMVKPTPDAALKVRNMLISTPAAPTMAPPAANASADAARMSTPDNCAAVGLTAMARSAVPLRVRVRNR